MLVQAQSLDKVLHVRGIASGYEKFFKAAGHSRGLAQEAAEVRLRAERKAGEILIVTAETGERDAGRGGDRKSPLHDARVKSQLSDLGISYTQSHRWQQIARIPEKQFEKYIEERMKSPLDELTTSGLMTEAKFAAKHEKGDLIRQEPQPLPTGPFRVIVADPPWAYAERRPTNDSRGYPGYSGMTIEEICALPVAGLADGDSFLWLWTTNAFLDESFDVCRAWGFKYRTLLTWGKNKIGLGDWLRGQTEHCLFASRGKPVVTLTAQSTLLIADTGEHSEKPEAFYRLVEEVCPAPDQGRLEMFARKPREGWRAWGAEVDETDV